MDTSVSPSTLSKKKKNSSNLAHRRPQQTHTRVVVQRSSVHANGYGTSLDHRFREGCLDLMMTRWWRTISADERPLPAIHHINSAQHATIERVEATVDIVEVGLRHATVIVNGGEEQLAFGGHLLHTRNACRGFLAVLRDACPLRRVSGDEDLDQPQDATELVVFSAAGNVPFLACAAASDSALLCIEKGGVSANVHEWVAPARCSWNSQSVSPFHP